MFYFSKKKTFISKRSRAADDSDFTRQVNVPWHNANFAFARLDNARAIGPDETRRRLRGQRLANLDHVLLGDALGDAHGQRDLGLDCVHDCSGGKGWWDVDDGGIRLDLVGRLLYRVENGQAQVGLAAFLGSDAADNVGAVGERTLGMESTLLSSEALDQEL